LISPPLPYLFAIARPKRRHIEALGTGLQVGAVTIAMHPGLGHVHHVVGHELRERHEQVVEGAELLAAVGAAVEVGGAEEAAERRVGGAPPRAPQVVAAAVRRAVAVAEVVAHYSLLQRLPNKQLRS